MRRIMLLSLFGLVAGGAAFGAEPQRLNYEIRKDGQVIGREDVSVDRRGDDLVVEVETHSRTTVLFMAFAFDHKRREEWRDGRLVRVVADTNDDGTTTELEAVRGDSSWRVVVNGTAGERPANAFPASLWTVKAVEAAALFGTIDAAPYQVRVSSRGDESITVMGGTVVARHYRLDGDLERDLWYGADGTLLKTTFKRKGFPIEFVRVTR